MLLALVAAIVWSTTSVLVDDLLSAYRLTPVDLAFWRTLLAAAALGLFIAVRRPAALRLTRSEVPYYLALGLAGVAALNLLWNASIQVNKAAVGAVLIFSAPAYVAVAGRLLFGEKLTALQRAAIAANLLGCALVGGVSDPLDLARHPLGLALGLGSGVPFALYTILSKGVARRRRRGPLTVLFYGFVFAALGLALWAVCTEGSALVPPPLPLRGWAILAALSLGPTLCGYGLYVASLRHLPAAVATLVTTLEPPLAAILALVVLNRAMSGPQWIGTALIIGGVIIVQGRSP